MKPQTTNHEVLFFTNTRFSANQFCEKQYDDAGASLSGQLQNACWNGMVFEIIPDLVRPLSAKRTGYTWEVIPAKNFIEIKIGAAPYTVDTDISLNPYLFLPVKNTN